MALVRTTLLSDSADSLVNSTLLDISANGTCSSSSAVVGKKVVLKTANGMSTAPTISGLTLVEFTVNSKTAVYTASATSVSAATSGAAALLMEA